MRYNTDLILKFYVYIYVCVCTNVYKCVFLNCFNNVRGMIVRMKKYRNLKPCYSLKYMKPNLDFCS